MGEVCSRAMPQGVCDRATSIQGDIDCHSFADEKPILIAPGFNVISVKEAKQAEVAETERDESLVKFSRRAFYLNIGKLVLSALGLTAAFAAIVATGVACPILPVVLASVYFMVVAADFICAWHDLEAAKSGRELFPMHSDSIANLFFKIFSCCGMSRRKNLKYSSIIASVTRVSLIVVGGTSSIVKVATMPPAVVMGITWLLNVMTLLKAGIEAYFNRKEPKEDNVYSAIEKIDGAIKDLQKLKKQRLETSETSFIMLKEIDAEIENLQKTKEKILKINNKETEKKEVKKPLQYSEPQWCRPNVELLSLINPI